MEWLERMRKSIEYIEKHLDKEIDFGEVARQAYCSPYHYYRIFLVMADMTLAEYVRRRRLTLAAQELQSGNKKVIEIALKYGYDSPDSFARAFQKMHGISPSAARASGAELVAFQPFLYKLYLKAVVTWIIESFKKIHLLLRANRNCSKRIPVLLPISLNSGKRVRPAA